MKLIALGDKEQKPIFGRDPKTGQELMVSQADARKRGLTDIIDPPSPEVAKALSAREFIPLGERANALIDKLDKEGKLGPLASRWNEFLAGNFGAGDADYEQLRTVMGLSTTKLMQLHVGARGGAYIMEHFEDLANAKKMDANVLRAGLKEELAYAHDIARDPNVRSEQKAGGFAAWKQRQGNQ